MQPHDDSLDADIRRRSRTNQPVIDALNATVPQADANRRDALEQRLMSQLETGVRPAERKTNMNYAPALRGAANPLPRRLNISTSAVLLVAVTLLCAAVVFFSLNPPPNDDSLPVAAPPDMEQDQPVVFPTDTETPTSTPFDADEVTPTPTLMMLPTLTMTPMSTMTPTPTLSAAAVSGDDVYYTVQDGDTVLAIATMVAREYGVGIEVWGPVNGIVHEQQALIPGQQILVQSDKLVPLQTEDIHHQVQAGDTLEAIAGWYNTDVQTLIRLNAIGSDMAISAGQWLLVKPATFTPPAISENGSEVIYTVQEGDTLTSIAQRYSYDVYHLMRINALRPSGEIFVGQNLIVGYLVPTPNSISANGEVMPPNAWFPADSHISEADGGGVIVVIDPNRLIETDMGPALTTGQTGTINLFTVVGVPPDQTIGAVGDGGDLAFSYVSVAAGAQLLNVNDLGYMMVQVTLEQGIVLNWLLNDTRVPFYYERAE